MSTAKKKKKRKLQVVTEEVKVREDRRKRQYQFWKDRVDNAQQRLCDDEFQLFGPEEEDIPSQFKKRTLVHNLYLTVATGRHQTSLQYVKTIRKQQYRKFRHRVCFESYV